MHALFADIKADKDYYEVVHGAPSTGFNTILFADDTACICTTAKALETYLHLIEKHSTRYGL